ncbi:hypothetical protein [Rhodopirellula sp. SWK7]|uniref:hypothetical protein n=1 Tax=Rhodopirellula sp. SWK7 TaxID=595460 RepID=UPI0002C03DF8|nr:hypothetical protein [Rhodopirellula sp. SWK7]EMI46528.1 hypothetical protein RRSWK_01008 [Rhodopirellula sp. SWK7]
MASSPPPANRLDSHSNERGEIDHDAIEHAPVEYGPIEHGPVEYREIRSRKGIEYKRCDLLPLNGTPVRSDAFDRRNDSADNTTALSRKDCVVTRAKTN